VTIAHQIFANRGTRYLEEHAYLAHAAMHGNRWEVAVVEQVVESRSAGDRLDKDDDLVEVQCVQ